MTVRLSACSIVLAGFGLAVSPALAAGGGDQGPGGIMTPAPPLFVWTIVTFLIVVVILRKFAWKPLLESLERRSDRIRGDLEAAQKARSAAEESRREFERQLEEARAEARKTAASIKEAADREKNRLLDKARREVEESKKQATDEIELVRKRAIEEISTRLGDLAVALAGKILEREIDAGRHRQLIEEGVARYKDLVRG